MNEAKGVLETAQTVSAWSDRAITILLVMLVLYAAYKIITYQASRGEVMLKEFHESLLNVTKDQNAAMKEMTACIERNTVCSQSTAQIMEKTAAELRMCREARKA